MTKTCFGNRWFALAKKTSKNSISRVYREYGARIYKKNKKTEDIKHKT